MTLLAIKAAIAFFLVAPSVDTTGIDKPASSEIGQNWELLPTFSDDFDSTNIDWTTKWSKNSGLPNVSAWHWDNDQNVRNNNGVVELVMRHNENNVAGWGGTYFTSGIIQSQAKSCYGYFEARIKGSAIPQTSDPSNYPFDWYGRGSCPAFWLWSFDYSEPIFNGKQVKYSEIDIVEIQQFDYYQGQQYYIQDLDLNLHTVIDGNWVRPKDDPVNQKNQYHMNDNPTQDFHIYGVENRPDSIFWYVDGVLVAAKRNLYWHLDMNLTVSLGVRVPFVKFQSNGWTAVNPISDARANAKLTALYDTTVNVDSAGTTKMYLDYIKTWKAMPSMWTEHPDSCSNVGNLEAIVNFQPGTRFYVDGALNCNLLEMDNAGNTVQSVANFTDNSVDGLYGGTSFINMVLDSITPTSGLTPGHYYVLESVFSNSNNEDIQHFSDTIKVNDSSTGIEELYSSSLNIVPNPASDVLFIKSKRNSGLFDVEIYNFQGKLIRQSTQIKQLDISDLIPGIYFLQTENKVFKFIKQ